MQEDQKGLLDLEQASHGDICVVDDQMELGVSF
jgi:hypothetical protein